MDILLNLSSLLQQSKEVGITGLGTFYKKKFPGRYDKEKQTFLPPSYALQFTTEVKDGDNFANSISNTQQISLDNAKNAIQIFVDDINKKLEVEHEAELADLGRLFFTEHNGLSFEPAKSLNYGSEFYGLPSLPEAVVENIETEEIEVFEEITEAPIAVIPTEQVAATDYNHPIENIELDEVKDDLRNTLQHTDNNKEVEFEVENLEEPKAEEVTLETPITTEAVADIPKTYINLDEEPEVTAPVIEAPAFIKEQHQEHPNRFGHDPLVGDSDEKMGMSLWLKIVIALVALAVAGMIGYLVRPDLFSPQAVVKTPPTVVVLDTPNTVIDTVSLLKAQQDSIARADSVLKANHILKPSDTAKTKPTVTKAPVVTAPVVTVAEPAKVLTFEIIASSYQSVKGAERYIAIMKARGYKAKIANMAGSWKKVSIASFKTRQEAEEQLPILQKKLNGKGFYIQQLNNTQP